jgi:hypothetical protein
MSRLEVPIRGRTLRTTGDFVLRAELVLSLKTDRGTWHHVLFLVDSGTEMTTMEASEARRPALPIPRKPVPGLTLHGQEVRAGQLRARIIGLDATEYVFPCFFVGDPNAPPPVQARNLLGLTGVINQVGIGFRGVPAVGAPSGCLIVERP